MKEAKNVPIKTLVNRSHHHLFLEIDPRRKWTSNAEQNHKRTTHYYTPPAPEKSSKKIKTKNHFIGNV
jgi:hypothetical protein